LFRISDFPYFNLNAGNGRMPFEQLLADAGKDGVLGSLLMEVTDCEAGGENEEMGIMRPFIFTGCLNLDEVDR
jgi:hypothetical protein